MERDNQPFKPPSHFDASMPLVSTPREPRGPILYFAVSGIVATILAIPLIVPRSLAVKDDPNPIGYLLILISFPVGGLVYRLRSRGWPVDITVRNRQIKACFATLLLPLTIAMLTGMRGQGFHMTMLSGVVSLIFMFSIFLSGQRRDRNANRRIS